MCIFCDQGNRQKLLLRETRYCVAICNRFPIHPDLGHFLIMPKAHRQNLTDLRVRERNDIFALVNDIMARIMEIISPDGVNVLFNQGVIAGQTIQHFHVHIIMRQQDDSIVSFWRDGERCEINEYMIARFRKRLFT